MRVVRVAMVLVVVATALQALALEAPHDQSNGIGCIDCHAPHGPGALLPRSEGQEAVCRTCHNPTGMAARFSAVANHVIDGGMSTVDCGSCHDPHGPQEPTPDTHPGGETAPNVSLVRTDIAKYLPGALEPVVFQRSPDHFAFDSEPYNGVCQACHSETDHFRNDGTGPDPGHLAVALDQHAGCTTCHRHENGFGLGGASGSVSGCGSSTSCHGTLGSHPTHVLPHAEGGMVGMECVECHSMTTFPEFADGETLATTAICNHCHSPGGTYDGVSDVTFGAKSNWDDGVYVGDRLSAGRDRWCAGCHDDVAAVVRGVTAPNVIGDEDADTSYGEGIGYGYYKTGHGLPPNESYPASGGMTPGAGLFCTECHDRRMAHVDGLARTYEDSATDGDPNDYQHGYRLKSVDGDIPMDIPRARTLHGGTYGPWIYESQFRLCFRCHDSSQFMQPYDAENPDATFTNFFKPSNVAPNLHDYHLRGSGPSSNGPRYDSDWDESSLDWDSRLSCPACHNVHGSSYLGMIRNGELVGREPGFRIYYADENLVISGSGWGEPENQSLTLGESTGIVYGPNPYMCLHCHGGHWRSFDRMPVSYAARNDADGDGTPDGDDNCPVDPQATQDDADGDGRGDICDPCPADPSNVNDTSVDADLDGVGDSCDVCPNDPFNDPDADGRCESDVCPLDALDDFESDGICGDRDNCPWDANADQLDDDGDGVGNACDNCPDDHNPDQTDSDVDGTGDACGPGFVTLHPSGAASPAEFVTMGGAWEDVLDSNDGDRSIVYSSGPPSPSQFTVDMDDAAGTYLDGATIESIRIYAHARYRNGGSGVPYGLPLDIGYSTGANTVWQGSAQTMASFDYTFFESPVFATDSDGGWWDPADVNDLQITVKRDITDAYQLLVTEVYVEVYFTR